MPAITASPRVPRYLARVLDATYLAQLERELREPDEAPGLVTCPLCAWAPRECAVHADHYN